MRKDLKQCVVHYKTVCPADLVANPEAITQLYGIKDSFNQFTGLGYSGELKEYKVRFYFLVTYRTSTNGLRWSAAVSIDASLVQVFAAILLHDRLAFSLLPRFLIPCPHPSLALCVNKSV